MKKIGLLFFSLILSANISYAQEWSNEKYKKTVEQTSEYSAYVRRFNLGDTTLTLKECEAIYYGWSFMESYDGGYPDMEIQKHISSSDFKQAYEAGITALRDNPACLSILHWTLQAAKIINRPKKEIDSLTARWKNIIQVISASGDGQSEKTSFKVMYIGDEYTFMQAKLSVTPAGMPDKPDSRYDIFTVRPSSSYKDSKVYFDSHIPGEYTMNLFRSMFDDE